MFTLVVGIKLKFFHQYLTRNRLYSMSSLTGLYLLTPDNNTPGITSQDWEQSSFE